MKKDDLSFIKCFQSLHKYAMFSLKLVFDARTLSKFAWVTRSDVCKSPFPFPFPFSIVSFSRGLDKLFSNKFNWVSLSIPIAWVERRGKFPFGTLSKLEKDKTAFRLAKDGNWCLGWLGTHTTQNKHAINEKSNSE